MTGATRRLSALRAVSALVAALASGLLAMWAADMGTDAAMWAQIGGGMVLILSACWVRLSGAGSFRVRTRWRLAISTSAPALVMFRDAAVLAGGLLVAAAVGGLVALAGGSALGARADGTRFEGWVAVGQVVLGVLTTLVFAVVLVALRSRIARRRTQGRIDSLIVTDSFEALAGLLLLLGVVPLVFIAGFALSSVGGEKALSAVAGSLIALMFSAFLAAPIYMGVRAAGNAWARQAATGSTPPTLWIVIPRQHARLPEVLAEWLGEPRDGPIVVVAPPATRLGGEMLVLAERLRLRGTLFPRNAGQLDDWLELLPPRERWWGLPVREWHPGAALLRTAVARHIEPADALVLAAADAGEVIAWQDLARNRVHRLHWLGDGERPPSAFDDPDPAPTLPQAVAGSGSAAAAPSAAPTSATPAPPAAAAGAGAMASAPPPAATAPGAEAAGTVEPAPLKRRRLEAEVASMRARGLPDEAPQLLAAQAELGLTLFQLGQMAAAQALQEHVLATRERAFGKRDPGVDTAVGDLLETLFEQSEYARALELTERLLASRRERLGAQHPDTLRALDNRSAVLWGLGRFEEARADSESALAGRVATLGAQHPDTLTTEGNLIHILGALGRSDEAYERRLAQLQRCLQALGPAHPTTLTSQHSLGLLQLDQRRLVEARHTFERCLDGRRLALGNEHPHTLMTLRELGNTLRALGQLEEGERRIREALEIARRTQGDDSVLVRETEAVLAEPPSPPADEAPPAAEAPFAESATEPAVESSLPASAAPPAGVDEAQLRAEFEAARAAAARPSAPLDDVEALGDAADRLAERLTARGEHPVDIWQVAWGTRRSLMPRSADGHLWIRGLQAALGLAAAQLHFREQTDAARTTLDEAWRLFSGLGPPKELPADVAGALDAVGLDVARSWTAVAAADVRALQQMREELTMRLRRPAAMEDPRRSAWSDLLALAEELQREATNGPPSQVAS